MHALLLTLAVATGFLKGQLHVHTNRSGDSATPPADVVRWYAEHGFDFIVLTDHERIGSAPGTGAMLVLPGVELTQNLETCTPPPPKGRQCLLHVNGLFVTPADPVPWPPATSNERGARYERALAVTRALGGIAQLNHPTFHLAADGPLVRRLAGRGLALMEVANQSVDIDNAPPGSPSTEAIWDEVLSSGARLWGTATDDAHHYYDAAGRAAAGEPVFVGDRGFVMVRATRDPAAIKAAIARGDFYASTGVILKRLERDAAHFTVEVEGARPCRIRFVGQGGKVLRVVTGTSARMPLAGLRGYVRAVVEDGAKRAYTQPVFLD